ncbi:unnamed protein product [Urochloa decumbens]|uniref:Uncharacterized protein n=1 Tax=Urochloa decumbens TaxID=240449 RepID=A0ABC9B3Z9_9POAL
MIVEAKAKALPMGFLDPEVLSLSTMSSDKSYVVDYLTKALKHFEKKNCIIFSHNTNGHRMLVVVVPRWGKVLYFDSIRSQLREHTLLIEVINESYLAYCRYKGLAEKVLVHATKFPCHQQPTGNTSGFYTASHMMEALQILHVEDPHDFEVSTSRIADDVLSGIREKIASFLMHQVIDSKGEFHCPTPGINMLGHSQ